MALEIFVLGWSDDSTFRNIEIGEWGHLYWMTLVLKTYVRVISTATWPHSINFESGNHNPKGTFSCIIQ